MSGQLKPGFAEAVERIVRRIVREELAATRKAPSAPSTQRPTNLDQSVVLVRLGSQYADEDTLVSDIVSTHCVSADAVRSLIRNMEADGRIVSRQVRFIRRTG